MEKIITKEIAQKLIKIKGEVRGYSPRAYGEVIFETEGEKGLKKLEDKMAELGFPTKYKKISSMRFYPIGLELITLLAIKDVFDYDDKKFQEIGKAQPKFSLIIKTFMSFVSIKAVAQQASGIWKRYYTIGDLEAAEIDEEKGYLILRLKNFHLHPLHCHILSGYFTAVANMATRKHITSKETKCSFRGDDCHEFLLKW